MLHLPGIKIGSFFRHSCGSEQANTITSKNSSNGESSKNDNKKKEQRKARAH